MARLLTVVSYERFTRLSDHYARPDVVLIFDEAHYLKSPSAKRTKAALSAMKTARCVWFLSGTPMPNNPAELWPVLHAAAPECILSKSGKPMSYWQFVAKYCRTIDKGFGLQIVGGKNHNELKARIAPFLLRRTKAEVLTELPPIAFEPLYVDGQIAYNEEARSQEAEAEKWLDADEDVEKAAVHLATLRKLTGLAKVDACIEWIRNFVESGRKLVVFAHHRDVIGMLADKFVHAVSVTGSTWPGARQAAVDAFQNDPEVRIFIGQIQAAGTGITLTAASDVLFVESSWVPADNAQAAMRVHRIGQSEPCLVRFATLAGSIDERIQDVVRRKSLDIAKIFGG